MKKFLLVFLVCLTSLALSAQTLHVVRGVVKIDGTDEPVEGAAVRIAGKGIVAETDGDGAFALEVPASEKETVVVRAAGFLPVRQVIRVDGDVNLGEISVKPDLYEEMREDMIISLSEAEYDSEDGIISSTQNISGLLTSGGDIFSSTAGYVFGPMRFRVRGYRGEYQKTYINGIRVDDAERGFFTYSQIGGLNDMVRNKDAVMGIDAASFSFGALGGATNINARASAIRKGLKVSQVGSNRTYTTRTMATYATGLMENGWAFAASASYRWADEGYVQGTFYDAWGVSLAAEKRFNNRHSLSLTLLGSPTHRGQQSGSTQEAYDLTPRQTFFRTQSSRFGNNFYNANWGYQNGKVRNAKQVKSFTPMAILSHVWNINEESKLTTSLGYKYQMDGRTSLNWYKAADPRPDYYRYLPNYHRTIDNEQAAEMREYMWMYDETYRQINWDRLYQTNYLANERGMSGRYMVENRRNDQSVATLTSVLNYKFTDRWKLDAGIEAQSTKGMHFKLVDDLLGANYWVDIDQYGERDNPGDADFMQNDLNNPNRKVYVGDRFGYDYDIYVNSANLWATATYSLRNADIYFSGSGTYSNFWREGNMKNGRASGDIVMGSSFNGKVYDESWYKTVNGSYGMSPIQNFLTYGVKAGGNYRITGRHIIALNVAHGTNAPLATNSYFSPRVKANLIPDLTPEMYVSADLTYYFRTPVVNGRITVYNTSFWNSAELSSFYNDEYNTYINFAMYGYNKRHTGAELGLEVKVSPYVTLSAVGAYGQNIYTSNPQATISMENGLQPDQEETIYVKGFHMDGAPEIAASLGVHYFHPTYWFVDLNVNYFGNTYMDFNPLRRTESAVAGLDPADPEQAALISRIREQDKFVGGLDGITVDLSIGKSIRINYKYYLNINLSATNILNNTRLKTGGYEQSRFSTTHERYDRETYLNRFPAKYFYAYGTTLYLNVGFRF